MGGKTLGFTSFAFAMDEAEAVADAFMRKAAWHARGAPIGCRAYVRFPPKADIALDSSSSPAFAFRPRLRWRSETDGGQAARKRCGAARPLTSAGWQVTVEDVRSGFPLAADLPPNDHVLAGVGLRSAVGRNRKTIRPTIERHVTRR